MATGKSENKKEILNLFVENKINAKQMIIPQNIEDSGFSVPVSQTFTGIKGVPFFSLAYNSMFPKLVLHEDFLTYKVMLKGSAKYSDIEKVVLNASFNYLTIIFKNSFFTLNIEMNQIEDLTEIMRFFERKSVLTFG